MLLSHIKEKIFRLSRFVLLTVYGEMRFIKLHNVQSEDISHDTKKSTPSQNKRAFECLSYA